MTLVYRSTLLSLLVQFLVGLTSAAGLFLPLPLNEESGLRTIFTLELSSQIVEFLWYILVVVWFKRIVTWTRYIDWVLSTPLMLISLAMFFHLRRGHPVEDVFAHGDIWITLAFNQLMLTCGFLLETRLVPVIPGVLVGSAALVTSFVFLGRYADITDAWSTGLFFTVYVIWYLYGVAALLPYTPKNVGYNLLDVVSKNCYGLFLFGYILIRA